MATTVPHQATSAFGDASIRRFQIENPEEDIDELRRRMPATRWPDKETVSDRPPGVQLEKLRPLVERGRQGRPLRRLGAA